MDRASAVPHRSHVAVRAFCARFGVALLRELHGWNCARPTAAARAAEDAAAAASHGGRRTLPRRLRAAVVDAQRARCADCATNLHDPRVCVDIDHAVPLAVWPPGERLPCNLRAVDVGCHALKTRRSGEAQRIARFRAALDHPLHRLCWLCGHYVSRHFFRGCACTDCIHATRAALARRSPQTLRLDPQVQQHVPRGRREPGASQDELGGGGGRRGVVADPEQLGGRPRVGVARLAP